MGALRDLIWSNAVHGTCVKAFARRAHRSPEGHPLALFDAKSMENADVSLIRHSFCSFGFEMCV
jgi:hypothetical protein